jgi:nucleoid DNA-binding protein
MNKDSLINKVYAKSPFNKGISKSIFDRIIELIKSSVKEDKHFEIENFGEFNVQRREIRTIIDVEKNEEILLPPKDKIIFKPEENLIKSINGIND